MSKPLLVVKYMVGPEKEEEFCKWYEAYLERFMARVPEMLTGRRVRTEKNGIREYMSIYEIESPEKVDAAMAHIGQDTPERIKDSEEWHEWVEGAMYYCTDAVWEELQLIENDKAASSKNKPLLIVRYAVGPEKEEEFCKWYEAYLERFMARVPEMLTGRRVRTEKNGVREYMSIYEIESPEKVDAAMAHIGQDTPERIKDSEEWHEWVEGAMYYCTDAVWEQLQLIER